MDVLVKIGQFLLSLSILVVLHELGHFVFAKLFKTRVEKFYMFFNPGFSLFKIKKGETEYGIGWIPLGGYVKISGMIDESMDKEQMALPPKPYEFRSKPAWQRLLIMIGGVLVNFILAFVIYTAVLFAWGEQYLPAENAKYGIVCDSLSESIGLKDGDIIVALDNQKVERFSQIMPEIILNRPSSIQVIRDGVNLDVAIPASYIPALIERSSKKFGVDPTISLRYPFHPMKVGKVAKDSPAKLAGLQKDDEIVSVNGVDFTYFDEYKEYLTTQAGKEINVLISRNNQELNLKLTTTDKGLIGFQPLLDLSGFKYEAVEYTFAQAIPAGIGKGFKKLNDYLKQFGLIFDKDIKGYKSIGGFGTIGSIFPSVWDWHAFWELTAFLSIILAIMNILPIPALDGGHVLFLMYEIITGRKPGDKFMEYAQVAGMVLLFGLLIFANANDVVKWVSNW
ncbi:RIP metalloprotease RseP [Marinifilum fragile]|uniref:RIP metalloprotease RseP n=1 Tax=Marinifilum fragile TaxID=570161 RepID=UPI002AAB6518|nr:RIP metalloprotease RseP [Marinifilum fragile]